MMTAMPSNAFSIQSMAGRGVVAVKARSGKTFVRHTHEEYGIGILLAGAQRSWSGRGTVEAGVGDLITVNPGEVHDGAPIGDSRTWAMLYLAPEKVSEVTRDIREGKSAEMEFASPVIRDPLTIDRFIAAHAAFRCGDEETANEQFILMIAGLLQDAPEKSREMPCLRQVRAWIDDAPAARHTLEDLANQAGLSRFQLLRGFAKYTGLTPHGYVTQRRLDIARSMIRHGADLADAAIDTGFADQSHFHRSFTRRYGLTPGAYAAAMR
ncbi:AraC family transcriptional regulator [Novosphingobium nitrogenifigens DSM 19370]|uniref:AraC family transcriptional regulator n=1 Tax=Novosphingobium nitrogenifigens DSM 19370 TaxID=983920 RepID=F1Z672_9SPHN|nr:AraC family transcriptional regulator [Novosphingobium nitrogenifigens]EGD59854.1 AraC family transcriptional regulator [Novosphingobium nitrogenifigens DSM 19370]